MRPDPIRPTSDTVADLNTSTGMPRPANQDTIAAPSSGAAEPNLKKRERAPQNDHVVIANRCLHLLREGKIEEFNKLRPANALDFSRQDLSGLDLRKADLRNVDLSRADLSGSDLSGALLQHAILDFADLSHTVLNDAKLFRASLQHANLEQVREAERAEFQEANLRDASLKEGNFSYAYFSNASLISAFLTKSLFIGAHLQGARLMSTTMVGTNFQNANLHKAVLFQANGSDVNFSGANLTQAIALNSFFKSSADKSETPDSPRMNFDDAWVKDLQHNGALNEEWLASANKYDLPIEGYFDATPTADDQKILVNGIPGSDKVAYDAALAELEELIGLDEVKENVRKLVKHLQHSEVRKALGEKGLEYTLHAVYTGSPGTGKTTVARIVGQLFYAMGALKDQGIVETDKSGMIAGYQGQTTGLVNKLIDSSIGRTLVIDEAYALAQSDNDSYAQDAIAVLVKRLEDDRDKFACVVCGYEKEMNKFIESNPGLKDRFSHFFHFQDFSTGQLVDIMKLMLDKRNYHYTPEFLAEASLLLAAAKVLGGKNFANGRTVRKSFEKMTWLMSERFVESGALDRKDKKELLTPTAQDLPFEEIAKVPRSALPPLSDLKWMSAEAPDPRRQLKVRDLPEQGPFPCLMRESYDLIAKAVEEYNKKTKETPEFPMYV
ncbi:MAG: pentapeptide repeat-containing protein [Bdellovibrionales bacterium]|nr:pentapeptide repeat-containing protein [Bdellovibrionales bacterium]